MQYYYYYVLNKWGMTEEGGQMWCGVEGGECGIRWGPLLLFYRVHAVQTKSECDRT